MGKKLAFWVAVGGVSVIANFVMEYAAVKLPSGGLRNFVSFLHSGGATQ